VDFIAPFQAVQAVRKKGVRVAMTGAFYCHFDSKDDFFIQIIENLLIRKMYSLLIAPSIRLSI
jgi:citrate lyase alpha subunit